LPVNILIYNNGVRFRFTALLTMQIALPNATAFEPIVFQANGDVYVTGPILGATSRFSQGGEAELSVQDALLEETEAFEFGVPLGANGIAYHGKALYVPNAKIEQ